MMRVVLAAWACGTLAALAPAQPPAPLRRTAPPPADDAALLDGDIDRLLRAWHERTQKIRTLQVNFQRTQKDAVFKGEIKRDGMAMFRAPNLARMDILADAPAATAAAPTPPKRLLDEVFILAKSDPEGKPLPRLEVWHYRVNRKDIEILEVPDDRGQNLQDDGPLKLLFGVNPEGAHARYDFKILQRTADMVELRIVPKLEQDRVEFLWTKVWLDLKTYLPRRLTVQETDDYRVEYDFPKQAIVDGPIPVESFRPMRPKNWTISRLAGAKPGQNLRPASDRRPPGGNGP